MKARVSGPRRPQIITSTRMSLPGSLRVAVMPVESPTVANAEMVSNMILSKGNCSVSISRNMASISTMVLTMMMASDRVTIWDERVRPKAVTWGRLVRNALVASSTTAKVVTLIPPPVEVAPAPMNISIIRNSRAAGVIRPMSMVLKPAVRALADWKKAASHWPPIPALPRVPGLLCSSSQNIRVPSSSRPGVMISISLLCSLSLRQRRLRTRSTMTVKPIPPRISRPAMVRLMTGSSR